MQLKLTVLHYNTQHCSLAVLINLFLLLQMAAIHHHLGVCPQFDIQYPELTAEEHLLFYARLKGVKWNALVKWSTMH